MPSLEEAMRQSEDSIEQLGDGLITPVNDVFFAVGRITEEQYNELMDNNKEEGSRMEFNL